MSGSLRGFHQAQRDGQNDRALLEALSQVAEQVESSEKREDAARAVHLPVAALRGALSSYSEVSADPTALRVCAGTSCLLAGGAKMLGQMIVKSRCHPVYCLGYCDRSPVAMTPDGRILARHAADGAANGSEAPPPPDVRCAARHPVVTARLLPDISDEDAIPGYEGLHASLRLAPEKVVETIVASGERGRGGAAYPTGLKWRAAAAVSASDKYVVANGDEGDPGSFVDRELMERDPHGILEGMAICAHAVGANRGYVFIRAEYPRAAAIMEHAIQQATCGHVLGADALGPGCDFHVEVVRGMGSYVCGEETALLAAIEGHRGEVRPRPPYPVAKGLFGCPTVVDNVETLVDIPWIMRHGAAAYAAMGTAESSGTKAICLNRGFARPGIVEVEFGLTLRELIEVHGGGGAGGVPLEAVLLGGPMGSIVTPDRWDVPVCFAAMSAAGISLGHAGLVAIPEGADWRGILLHLLRFVRDESCGKCVPCSLGGARAERLVLAGLHDDGREELERVLDLMRTASLCAFGRETPGPVRTILERFGDRVLGGGTG